MKISVHLRPGANKTNMRSEALSEALESHGYPVTRACRGEVVKGSELVIQTGFGRTTALMDAIERQVPYIIMEAPFWRDYYDIHTSSSWGYNGLAGGAWRPQPPEEERPKPTLQPMKEGDRTLIIGQKPTDHSLRGSDHVQWILQTKSELPEADFRHHPLMVGEGIIVPIREALRSYDKVVTYTSTVGAEALVAGLEVRADHRGSAAYGVTDRDGWVRDLSWSQGLHSDFYELVAYILGGYEESRYRMQRGLYEVPREIVDGKAICERYYRLILP